MFAFLLRQLRTAIPEATVPPLVCVRFTTPLQEWLNQRSNPILNGVRY